MMNATQGITSLPDRHPYFKACRKGDLEALKAFWSQGISIYASGEFTRDAMGTAFEQRNLALMHLLFDYGFEVDHPMDVHENSPLVFALRNKDLELVTYFLERGAHVNRRNEFGWTPIFSAVCTGEIGFVTLMAERGADLHARTHQEHDVFWVAASAGRFPMMDYILSLGFAVDTCMAGDATPLINAAQRGAVEVCRWLLEHGANKNARDTSKMTALDYAKMNKHQPVVELLEKA
jgi:ankyrin repeat protein